MLTARTDFPGGYMGNAGAQRSRITEIAAIVGMITGCLGLSLALIQQRNGEALRRQQMALELIHMPPSIEYVDAINNILSLPGEIDVAALKQNPQRWRDAYLVMTEMERRATLVEEGILDLDVLDRMVGGVTRACWRKLEPVVRERRKENQRAGERFERLVARLQSLQR
jgi:hypothetical protein